MKVIVTEPIHPDPLRLLGQHVDVITWDHEAARDWSDADAVIVRAAAVTREQIASAPRLKVIGKHGIGVNAIDVAAAREYDIQVVYTPTANVNSVAELAIGMMLTLGRKLEENMRAIQKGAQRIAPPELTGRELQGKAIGLVGFGRISQRLAHIARHGFDMRIHAFDPFLDAKTFATLGVERHERLTELFKSCDVVSVSVPYTPETHNLIRAEHFACCRPGAVFINTARGGVVNETDLYNALKSGQIFGAGSDVFEQEPPRADNPLFSLPNFIGSLHIGANTEEALLRVGATVVDDVLAVLEGRDPVYPYRGN